MSEKTRHTEGPWELGEDHIVTAGMKTIADVLDTTEGLDGDDPEALANGYLISAAPELLAYAECQQAFDAYYHAPEAGATEEARMIEIFAHHGIISEPNQPRRRDALIAFGCAAIAKATRPAAPSGG